jgi:hypothetical protein
MTPWVPEFFQGMKIETSHGRVFLLAVSSAPAAGRRYVTWLTTDAFASIDEQLDQRPKSLYVPFLFRSGNEGRIAIVTDVGSECDGRSGAARRAVLRRTAKPCGSDAAVLAPSFARCSRIT